MKKLHLSKILTVAFFVLLFAVVLTVSVGAKTTDVAAGSGTLSAAINDADPGDVLNLTGGEYTESATIEVGKSLTIQGSGTVTSATDIFKITGADVEMNLGGSVFYTSTKSNGRGIYIAASNFTVNFKDSVNMTTGAHCVEDMAGCAGTVTVSVASGTTVKSTGAACFNFDNNTGTNVDVKVTILGGTLTAASNIVRVTYAKNVDLAVNGGNLTASSNAINLDGATTIVGKVNVTITKGSVKANSGHAINLKTSKAVTTLIISGGSITGKDMGMVLNGLPNGSSATISGDAVLTTTDRYLVHLCSTPSGSTVTVNVTGGSWACNQYCINNDSGSGTVNVNISGGVFTTDQYLVRGGVATNASITGGNITVAGLTTGDVTKTTALVTYVDANGKTVYADLATAVANVPAGGAITVGENLTLSEKINVTKSMTITGTGKVSSTKHLFEITGANVELTLSGSVAYTTTGGRGIYLSAANPTINLSDTVTLSTFAHCIESTGNFSGTATVKATATAKTFTASVGSCFCFNGGAGSISVEIENGTFESVQANGFLVNNANKPNVTITVKGGTVQSKSAVFNLSNVGTTTIQGVTYTTADGKNACVASFADAVANVAENGTVTVYGNLALADTVSVTKSMTINGNGTLTLSKDAAIVAIKTANIKVTFAGTVTYSAADGTGIHVTQPGIELVFEDSVSVTCKRNAVRDASTATGTTTITVSDSCSFTSTGGNCFYFGDAVGSAEVTVNNGIFNAPANVCFYFNANVKDASLILNDGKFNATSSIVVFNQCSGTCALTVKDGELTSDRQIVNVADNVATVDLQGGIFTAPVLFNTNNKFVGAISNTATLNVDHVIHGATYVSAGKTVYATLPVAIANVAEKGTVTVIGNPSVAPLAITRSLTVEGTGTVTSSGIMFDMSTAGVELTLQGNVKYVAANEGVRVQANGITVNLYDSIEFTTTGSFMKDATTVTASTTTVNVFGGTYTAGGHVFEFSQGTGAVTLEIANGTFTSTANCAISITKAGVVSVTIRNGKFTGDDHAINIDGHPGGTDYTVASKINGTVALTILDGEFTGKTVHAINLKYAAEATTVNVSGGTFIGGNVGMVLNALADGSSVTVAGVKKYEAKNRGILIANTQADDEISVTVSGGDFEAKNASECFFDVANSNAGNVKIAVTGGAFRTLGAFVRVDAAAVEVTVSGGTVETCTNGFELKNAASGSVTVSDAASITATANVFSVTNGYQAQLNIAGGSLTAPVLFHTDYELVPEISTSATVDVDYKIHGATYVNADGKTVYATFVTAVANVPAKGIVTVEGNSNISSVTINKDMTIQGSGTVTATSTIFVITASCELTLGGSVAYDNTGSTANSGISVESDNVTVNFKDSVSFTTQKRTIYDTAAVTAAGTTKVNVYGSGCKFNAKAHHGFNFGDNGKGAVEIYIEGGEFKAGTSNLCFNTEAGKVTVTVLGGKFEASANTFYVLNRAADFTATISNGEFDPTAHVFNITGCSGKTAITMNNGTYTPSQSVVNMSGLTGESTVTVANGTLDSVNAVFNIVNAGGKVTCNINGGTFKSSTGTPNGIYFKGATGAVELNVTGGKFEKSISNALFLEECTKTIAINLSKGTTDPEIRCCTHAVYVKNNTAATEITVSGGVFAPSNTFIATNAAPATINMTGGTVESCQVAFRLMNTPSVTVGETDVHSVVNVSGNASIVATVCVLATTGGNKAQLTVSGGSYTAPVFFSLDSTITPVISDTAVIDVDYMINGATFTDGEGNTVYAELAVAVNAVAAGGTVTVQGNPTVTDSIRVRQDVVINGAGTVTSTTTIFNVERSVVLTLKGDVVYQTANNNVGFSIGADNVTLNLEGKIVFHTKGNLLQDSAHITADGTTTVNVYGGTFNANGHGFYFGLGAGTVKLNVSGGTVNSLKNCVMIAKAYAADATVTVTGGTLVAKGSARDSSCIYLGGASNGESITCTVYGGVFLSDTGYANIYVEGNNTDAAIDKVPTVNVYGGYFEDGRTACVYVYTAGVVNIYGGYFRYTGVTNVYGSNVNCQGKGVVNVYGGNFRSQGSGVAFTASTANATVNLVGSFNAIGGGALISNKNTAAGTPSTGYPVGKELYNASVYMTDGAGIRLVEGSNGLRFVGVITAEALAYINTIAEAGSVSFGTLIAPADLVALADSFTADGLTRAGVKFVDLPAKDGLVARAGGGYYIRAAIVNIREENLSREFAAVSYVKYTVNGEEVVIYASYRETKNARAIDQVARMALKDGGIYTEAQLNVLRAYAPTTEAPVIDFYLIAGQSNAAGSTNFQSDFANSNPNFKNGYSNVYYSGFSMSGSGIANKMVHSAVPVKIGYGNSLTNFGPELGLADALSSHYNEESGKYAAIIKYAYSGINLYDTVAAPCDAEGNWCPPSWLAEHGMVDAERSGQHYRSFVNYIAECVSDYEAMGYEVNIVSAYWMQGEQDVGKHADTGEYDDLLTCFINDLRNDVAGLMGDEKYLELPVMIGELSTYLSEPSSNPTHFGNTAGLIAAQHQVAAALSNVLVLDQSNIPSFDIEPGENANNKDRYHWICENMLWIGQQLGYTVLEEILEVEVSFADEDIVAEVYLNDDLIGSYKSLVGAISNAPAGAVIKLTKDVTLYSTLVIGNTNAITIDGCGNTLNIVVPAKINTGSTDDNLNCGAFRLYATDLTVRNLKVTLNANINASVKGVYTLFGANVVWNDCTFTQGENTTNDFATVTENITCSFDWSEIISEA